MESLVASRRAELSGESNGSSQAKQKQDLFSLMIKSSQEEGPAGMSDDELASFVQYQKLHELISAVD